MVILLIEAEVHAAGKSTADFIILDCAIAEVEKIRPKLSAVKVMRFIVVFPFNELSRHAAAAFGATAASVDAVLHVTNLFVAFGAVLADIGAFRAHMFVVMGAKKHKIRRGLAGFGTGQHQPKVHGFDMFAANLQAMTHRHAEADGMAAQTFVDAGLHVR